MLCSYYGRGHPLHRIEGEKCSVLPVRATCTQNPAYPKLSYRGEGTAMHCSELRWAPIGHLNLTSEQAAFCSKLSQLPNWTVYQLATLNSPASKILSLAEVLALLLSNHWSLLLCLRRCPRVIMLQ